MGGKGCWQSMKKNKIMPKLGTMVPVEARPAWLGTLLATQICPGNRWLGGYVQVGEKEASRSCVRRGRGYLLLFTLEWQLGARLLHHAPPPSIAMPTHCHPALSMNGFAKESHFDAISNKITINQLIHKFIQ